MKVRSQLSKLVSVKLGEGMLILSHADPHRSYIMIIISCVVSTLPIKANKLSVCPPWFTTGIEPTITLQLTPSGT